MPNVLLKPSRFIQSHWPALLIGSVWLWMFWPMISGQTVCGFRDSAYLYYPLFKWIDSVWASGEIPLWNPYCNYGLPVVGDGSSSVFYPGKLIFLCRFLSYPSRYGIYLSVHVLIAAAGAYRFARTMKANQAGATLTAISYAFGGSVLFQVTNVIYLVSAAWLPFALLFVWRGILGGDWRSAVWAGVVCALMILGGDPQMVYHVGLIAAASVLFRFWKRRRWLLKNTRSSCHAAYRWATVAGCRLLLMIVVTSCLAAIQILPTAHWAERSERAASGEISNLMQAWNHADKVSESTFKTRPGIWSPGPSITNLDSTITEAFFSHPSEGSQKDATYQFSQPPWSIAELFFPNVMGKPFPTHQRWSDVLPAAERIWTPSIYAGVLTILLALSQFRLWGKRKRHVWLSRIAMFFALASFGWFGLAWLLNEGLAVVGLSELEINGIKIGPQVGGLYWFMVTVLPKYFMFRYPAKLFVIASLMLSVLAGLGISTSSTRKRVDIPTAMNPLARASSLYCVLIICVFCIIGLITLQLAPIESWLGSIRPNLFFGPMDVASTMSALNISLIHPLVVIAILIAITWLAKTNECFQNQVCSTGFSRNSVNFRLKAVLQTIQTGFETALRSQKSSDSNASTFLAVSIVLLTAIDVTLANQWMLAEVSPMAFEAPTEIAKQLDQLKADYPDSVPRIYRSFNAQAREQTWPRATSNQRLEEIINWRRETLFPKHHLKHEVSLLGSFGSVWPSRYAYLTNSLSAEFAEKGYLLKPMPNRYRLAGQMVEDRATDSLALRRETLLAKGVEFFPKRNRFTDSSRALAGPWPIASQLKGVSRIESVRHTNSTITANVQTDQDIQLQICVLHDEGWQAELKNFDSSSVTKLKITPSVDQIGMRVDLPPGRHIVTFTYSPREFWIGLWISGTGWIVLVIALLATNKNLYRRWPAQKAPR